jgi:hypothetical protein
VLSVEGAEVKRFGEIFSEIVGDGFITWGTAFYSAIRSELTDVSTAVSAGGEVFVESAFVGVRDDRSA